MKYIQKQSEPLEFTTWKKRSRTYARFKKTAKIKHPVKTALMKEQGYLCCYCERRLLENDSHIEHLRPQSDPDVDPLNFSNLLCSCQKELQPDEPRHCGNAKANCDPSLLVSPLDSTCEKRFTFSSDGHIQPTEATDSVAMKTIEQLQLDILKLRAFRRGAIAPFLDPDLSDADFQDLVKSHLTKDSSGRFGGFWTTIDQLFGGEIT
ncbi:MAG: retron system putative HNH endonuclease [Cyanobacteria bacterium J06634_6]